MNNIHLLTEINDELINGIINDSTLNPTARFILIEMIQNDGTPFSEESLMKQYPMFNRNDVADAFELLVIVGYLKRIVSPDNDTQYYIALDKDFDEQIKLFN